MINFNDLITKANEKDVKAMNMIHNYYCLENYMTQDYNDDLIKLITEGANHNKPYSLFHLGIMNLLGSGIKKDFDKGIELIKKSMNVKCSQAYYLMAMLVLANQTQYELDYDQLITIAMQMKNSSAFVQRGIEYSDKDMKKSAEFFRKAIKLDNDIAIYRLGELYHDHKKYKLAIKYYNQAMSKNIHHACFNLAVMYREGETKNVHTSHFKLPHQKDGEGVDINIDTAKELFTKAMDMGNVRAITCIGGIYEEQGNIKEAKKYYKMAIAKGDTFAKYNLGIIYQKEDKHKKAIKCFILGAKDGHTRSEQILVYDYNVTNLDMNDKEIDQLLNFHYAIKDFGAYDGFLSR